MVEENPENTSTAAGRGAVIGWLKKSLLLAATVLEGIPGSGAEPMSSKSTAGATGAEDFVAFTSPLLLDGPEDLLADEEVFDLIGLSAGAATWGGFSGGTKGVEDLNICLS